MCHGPAYMKLIGPITLAGESLQCSDIKLTNSLRRPHAHSVPLQLRPVQPAQASVPRQEIIHE